MIRRLFPAPLLSLALLAIWLVLNRDYSLGQVLLGALVATIVPRLTQSLARGQGAQQHTPVPHDHIPAHLHEQAKCHAQVADAHRGGAQRLPRGGFITVPLDLRDPSGLAVLAAIMCVIPGTIWSEIALDRSALLVHIFDLADAQDEIELIKTRYERPLMEIFE